MLLHVKEYLRTTNTGHLIPLAHPGSRMLISGLEADDEELSALHASDPESFIVLFPSQDALSLDEFKSRREDRGVSHRRVKVVLLDGTWAQARTLNRRWVGPGSL